MTSDLLETLGEPLSVYSDAQALRDGLLVDVRGLFPAAWTLNRVTRALWDHYTTSMGTGPTTGRLTDVSALILALTDAWHNARDDGGWRIGTTHDGKTVWFVPNEADGYTAMFPEDY